MEKNISILRTTSRIHILKFSNPCLFATNAVGPHHPNQFLVFSPSFRRELFRQKERTTTSKLRIRNHDISLPALSQYPIFPPFLSPPPFSSLAALYKGTFLVYLINFFCHSFILSPFSLLIRLHSKKEKKKKHKKKNKNSLKIADSRRNGKRRHLSIVSK